MKAEVRAAGEGLAFFLEGRDVVGRALGDGVVEAVQVLETVLAVEKG